nr:MAG TPA: hypothetical protein [Caudoviricetes sp.]
MLFAAFCVGKILKKAGGRYYGFLLKLMDKI